MCVGVINVMRKSMIKYVVVVISLPSLVAGAYGCATSTTEDPKRQILFAKSLNTGEEITLSASNDVLRLCYRVDGVELDVVTSYRFPGIDDQLSSRLSFVPEEFDTNGFSENEVAVEFLALVGSGVLADYITIVSAGRDIVDSYRVFPHILPTDEVTNE